MTEDSRKYLQSVIDEYQVLVKELMTQLEHMDKGLRFLEDECERSEEHIANRGNGGMGMNLMSSADFAQCPPSVIARIRWHIRNIRRPT